jgi:hypothetical protein
MMMSNGFEIILASVPDRDDLVAEIWRGDSQFAEVRREEERFFVELYPNPKDLAWIFEHSELIEALNAAERRLRDTVA